MSGSSTTVQEFIRRIAATLESSGVCFGHGTDNAIDEAAELVFYAAGLRHENAAREYGRTLTSQQRTLAMDLLKQRIERRVPSAYLTKRMWFCGHEFYVDERVLIPRSPIAELIERQFAPWIDPAQVKRILDIGTGSGCIAIACAYAFEDALADAADISNDALEVTRLNIQRHRMDARVRAVQSDVFSALANLRYDIIVSNPPYVSAAEVAELPEEYCHEPKLGLLAGDDGLEIVRRILADAETHLTPHGILVVEVGDTEETLTRAFPNVPFTWLEFERGGGGVFLLTAAELAEYRDELR